MESEQASEREKEREREREEGEGGGEREHFIKRETEHLWPRQPREKRWMFLVCLDFYIGA